MKHIQNINHLRDLFQSVNPMETFIVDEDSQTFHTLDYSIYITSRLDKFGVRNFTAQYLQPILNCFDEVYQEYQKISDRYDNFGITGSSIDSLREFEARTGERWLEEYDNLLAG